MSVALPSIHSPDRIFIDGDWVAPDSDRRIDVINPATEDLFLTVADGNEADIARAVTAARRAFDEGPWPRLSHAERATYIEAIGQALLRHAAEAADAWTSEIGILRSASGGVLGTVFETYAHYAALAHSFPFIERRVPRGGNVGLLVREPVGVVGAIVPWNSPITMIAHKIAPALLAGCTVVVKTSPEAPAAGLIMAEICREVGLPNGVVNFLTADREASEALVRHPDVDKITFTGSSATGKSIASICGARMARCTMELGGTSAGIILDDFDLAVAARSIAGTARIMSGQVCSSLTRIIISQHRHDALVEALAAEFSATVIGDPFLPETQMGPVAGRRQRDRIEGYIRKGIEDGAVLATGGGRPAHLDRGFFVEPTVFASVDNAMTIAREEIFGPVLSVIPAKDERDAVAIANASVFGLNGSVFTNDIERAWAVARDLRCGTVGHNSWRTDFSMAFGGYKESGIGREGSVDGLMAFLETKTVILDQEPAGLPAWDKP
jgi:acyl-CoA reductase-like NAD-dependent aldehyde dehydrogenase